MTEQSSNLFYELPACKRDQLLVFHGKAHEAVGTRTGFSGEVVFLDNGVGVYPRLTCAKFPRQSDSLSPSERAKRFLREIKLQAEAHYHPNVHWPFHMALILGVPVAFFRCWEGDLSHYIEKANWGDLGRLSLMIQLAAGLMHCHDRGLIHQDLKPENIFVRDLRKSFALPPSDLWLHPLVADFGSVNLAAWAKVFRGSRPYMAPEQWNETALGECTTVFVFGVILHEIMSRGIHPIGDRSYDWHRQINPGFNRWQVNNYWRKWVEDGCKIAQPLDDQKLARLVANCLTVSPDDRPPLSTVQETLLEIMCRRSDQAAQQVNIFLSTADCQSTATEWEHLKNSIEDLERAINEHYPQDINAP